MQRRSLALIFFIKGLLLTTLANALGMGEITLNSSLNEPLDAEIRLLEVRELTKSDIVIRLASREAFKRAGVERVFFLNDITFDVDLSNPSTPVLHLRSTKSVVEPYLNFLLEVQWPSGRLLREYTLLMDLPLFDSNSSTSPVAAPRSQATVDSSRPSAGAGKPLPSLPEKPVYPSVKSSSKAASQQSLSGSGQDNNISVAAGDTLWEIALQARPDKSVMVHQSMLAIQRANPGAFIDGNINLLRKGAMLRIPGKAEMLSIPVQQSISEVARQNRQWANDRSGTGAILKGSGSTVRSNRASSSLPTGRLKLSAIDKVSTSAARVSGAGGTGKSLQDQLTAAQEELDRERQENIEFSERVQQLETQIDTMEKLIAVSNDKLRALQLAAEKKNQQDTAGDILETPDVNSQSPEAVEVEQSEEGFTAEPSSKEPSRTEHSIESQDALSPSDETAQSVESTFATDAESSFLGRLKDNINYIIAGIVALLFFGVLLIRFRKKDDDRDNDDELDAIDEITSVDERQSDYQEVVAEQINDNLNDPLREDDINLDDDQLEDPADDNVNPVDKANIFISLGQYDQAERQLLREIEANPGNINARLTLLKVYSETQDISEFDIQYAQLLPMGDFGINEKAKALRSRIQNAGDFDVTQYVSGDAAQLTVEDQYVTGKDQQVSMNPTADSQDDSPFDLDFSDLDKPLENDQPLFADEKQAENTVSKEKLTSSKDQYLTDDDEDTFSEMTLDLDDLSLDEQPIDEQSLDEQSSGQKFGYDELGYEGQGGKIPGDDIGDDEPALDFESDSLNHQDQADSSIAGEDESDVDELEHIDFTEASDSGVGNDGTSSKAKKSVAETPSFIEVADEQAVNSHPSTDEIDMASLDKEISSMIVSEQESTGQRDQPSSLDDDLNTLSDESDQVEIKLDLALAYLDMGDTEGARDILSEVIEEGTSEQQDKAHRLLSDL